MTRPLRRCIILSRSQTSYQTVIVRLLTQGKFIHNYDVAFSALRIRKTRSRGDDTLWIKITVAVDGVNRGSATWDGTGGRDTNDGYYDGLRNAGNHIIVVATGPINESSVVKVSFLSLITAIPTTKMTTARHSPRYPASPP